MKNFKSYLLRRTGNVTSETMDSSFEYFFRPSGRRLGLQITKPFWTQYSCMPLILAQLLLAITVVGRQIPQKNTAICIISHQAERHQATKPYNGMCLQGFFPRFLFTSFFPLGLYETPMRFDVEFQVPIPRILNPFTQPDVQFSPRSG